MTLRIDEAERIAAAERNRVRQGEEATAALKWLIEFAGEADLKISCRTASALPGHVAAMAYLNILLGERLGGLIEATKMRAQGDMDYFLGNRDDR